MMPSSCGLRWYCEKGAGVSEHSKVTSCNSDKLDCLVSLVEKLLVKLTAVENSLTSKICKLFESIIRDNLVHHLESNYKLSTRLP